MVVAVPAKVLFESLTPTVVDEDNAESNFGNVKLPVGVVPNENGLVTGAAFWLSDKPKLNCVVDVDDASDGAFSDDFIGILYIHLSKSLIHNI